MNTINLKIKKAKKLEYSLTDPEAWFISNNKNDFSNIKISEQFKKASIDNKKWKAYRRHSLGINIYPDNFRHIKSEEL